MVRLFFSLGYGEVVDAIRGTIVDNAAPAAQAWTSSMVAAISASISGAAQQLLPVEDPKKTERVQPRRGKSLKFYPFMILSSARNRGSPRYTKPNKTFDMFSSETSVTRQSSLDGSSLDSSIESINGTLGMREIGTLHTDKGASGLIMDDTGEDTEFMGQNFMMRKTFTPTNSDNYADPFSDDLLRQGSELLQGSRFLTSSGNVRAMVGNLNTIDRILYGITSGVQMGTHRRCG